MPNPYLTDPAALDELEALGDCDLGDDWGYRHCAKIPHLIAAVRTLRTENERLRNALIAAKWFLRYARFELEPKHADFEQFPCQECCDRHLQNIAAALAPQPAQEGQR